MSHKSMLQLGEGGTSDTQMCHGLSVTRWEMTTLCFAGIQFMMVYISK